MSSQITYKFTQKFKPEAIVLGGSAGSIRVVCKILSLLPKKYNLPIIIALHRGAQQDSALRDVLANNSLMPVIEPKGLTEISAGNVYLAPADFHLIVEPEKKLNIVKSALVQYSRPSIDVLLFSAAEVYKENLLGILVTGANKDGAMGMKIIKDFGGTTIVQDPKEATISHMPLSAIEAAPMDYILPVDEIIDFLLKIHIKAVIRTNPVN